MLQEEASQWLYGVNLGKHDHVHEIAAGLVKVLLGLLKVAGIWEVEIKLTQVLCQL